jgi:Na+/glutamate symporter
MELQAGILHVESFLAVTIGILVLFVGKRLNDQVRFLRELSIPEPVTGGLLFSILFGLLYAASGIEVDFALRARDILLVYFFTTIGINASARDLLAGGRPLVILLAITIAFMINRHQLTPSPEAPLECQDVGLSDAQKKEGIGHLDFLDAVLAIHICIVVGFLLNGLIADLGLRLPLFVTCLFAGILITNLVPKGLPSLTGTHWPSRTPAMALIADIALSTFLAMSLMSMQLWTLIDLAGPILTILAAQFVLAVTVTVVVLFPLMGRDYDAAVVAAGFGGVTLGSTPTAMANMAAVTQRFGPSHRAFIIVPLVSAFFIDLANAMAIPFFCGPSDATPAVAAKAHIQIQEPQCHTKP